MMRPRSSAESWMYVLGTPDAAVRIAQADAALYRATAAGRNLAAGPPTTPAFSAPAGFAGRPTDLMTRFDSDRDGSVDAAEYVAYLAKGFNACDVDGNGVLDGCELPTGGWTQPSFWRLRGFCDCDRSAGVSVPAGVVK